MVDVMDEADACEDGGDDDRDVGTEFVDDGVEADRECGVLMAVVSIQVESAKDGDKAIAQDHDCYAGCGHVHHDCCDHSERCLDLDRPGVLVVQRVVLQAALTAKICRR
mmetsp:Transcript_464/g.770  ORF Transcript_464/g.770 Transcript_464/m.770 type:complete len:109 (+) Transcript_464:1886-2212(+)